MKAAKTVYIGLLVLLLSIIQLILESNPIRFIGIGIGIFFIIFGWKIGWTRNRNFTVFLGYLALVLGCLVTTYAIYQIPFITKAPAFIEVFDMPLFWGIFTIFGGYCMITHSYCTCAIKMHNDNQLKLKASEKFDRN